MTSFLTAVRHEVNNLESSVVLQELEFAINRALYGLSYLFTLLIRALVIVPCGGPKKSPRTFI